MFLLTGVAENMSLQGIMPVVTAQAQGFPQNVPPNNSVPGVGGEIAHGGGGSYVFSYGSYGWTGDSATITASSTDFIEFGMLATTTAQATETNAQTVVPQTGIANNLRCFGTTAAQSGGVVYTLRDGAANTALTCTMNNVNTTSCSDVTHQVSLAAGDLIDIQVVNSNSANATGITGCSFTIH